MSTTLRIEKIEIEVFKPGSDPLIRISASKVVEDKAGNIIQVMPADREIFRRAKDVALQEIHWIDPTTNIPLELTAASIQAALTAGVYTWFGEEFQGQLTNGKFYLED